MILHDPNQKFIGGVAVFCLYVTVSVVWRGEYINGFTPWASQNTQTKILHTQPRPWILELLRPPGKPKLTNKNNAHAPKHIDTGIIATPCASQNSQTQIPHAQPSPWILELLRPPGQAKTHKQK